MYACNYLAFTIAAQLQAALPDAMAAAGAAAHSGSSTMFSAGTEFSQALLTLADLADTAAALEAEDEGSELSDNSHGGGQTAAPGRKRRRNEHKAARRAETARWNSGAHHRCYCGCGGVATRIVRNDDLSTVLMRLGKFEDEIAAELQNARDAAAAGKPRRYRLADAHFAKPAGGKRQRREDMLPVKRFIYGSPDAPAAYVTACTVIARRPVTSTPATVRIAGLMDKASSPSLRRDLEVIQQRHAHLKEEAARLDALIDELSNNLKELKALPVWATVGGRPSPAVRWRHIAANIKAAKTFTGFAPPVFVAIFHAFDAAVGVAALVRYRADAFADFARGSQAHSGSGSAAPNAPQVEQAAMQPLVPGPVVMDLDEPSSSPSAAAGGAGAQAGVAADVVAGAAEAAGAADAAAEEAELASVVLNQGKRTIAPTARGVGGRHTVLEPIDQFFLVLLMLRTAFTEAQVSWFLGISSHAVSETFVTVLGALDRWLRDELQPPPPDAALLLTPTSVHERFGTERATYIVDATEVHAPDAQDARIHAATYSQYKNTTTAKVTVMAHALGFFTEISDAYVGSTADDAALAAANLLDGLPDGSLVLVDRGYRRAQELTAAAGRGLQATHPPFRERNQQQLAADLVLPGSKVASSRTVVERLIGRAKRMFRKIATKPYVTSIDLFGCTFRVGCLLTNFLPPLRDAMEGGTGAKRAGSTLPAAAVIDDDDGVGDIDEESVIAGVE